MLSSATPNPEDPAVVALVVALAVALVVALAVGQRSYLLSSTSVQLASLVVTGTRRFVGRALLTRTCRSPVRSPGNRSPEPIAPGLGTCSAVVVEAW